MQQHFENQQGALLTWESWGDRTSPSMGFQDGSVVKNTSARARFGSTYTKIGTIQRRLAWPLRKDDTQIREAFHI